MRTFFSLRSYCKTLLPLSKFLLQPHKFLCIVLLLSLFAVFATTCIVSADEEFYVSASTVGTKFTASSSTTYRFTITSGAYAHTESAEDGWATSIKIYKNREIEWDEGDCPGPINPDYSIGKNHKPSYDEAEQAAKGTSVDIPLEENEYVIFVADDCKFGYSDNLKGIYFSISEPYLLFSDDFERSDYSDKWTSGVLDDCTEENTDTITIVNGYIQSTDNCNYIESLESFSGNLRIEVAVMKVGQGDMPCWDFFVELVSTGLTGTIVFDYNGIDAININTSRDCGGDNYTMNSSGVNKGKAVLTYSGSRAWFSFTNDDGNVLETDKILIGPFVASKIRISLAAHQDSPRYIDNVKVYSLGSSTASTPTPTPTPTPKKTPTPTPSPTPAAGTGVIYGFVADLESFALKKVSVTLTDSSDYSRTTTTDTDGYYEFTGLEADDYTITYEKDGYQTQTKSISLDEDESLDLGTLKMEETEMSSISGYVVDIRGDPVESVKLKLKGIKTKTFLIESSDADGFFEFADLTADDYVVTASRKKYKTTRKSIALDDGEAAEIEIEMRKTTRRRGISQR